MSKTIATTTAASSQEPSLSSEHVIWRWRILTSTYLGYAGYYLTRNVFVICKPEIRDSLKLGHNEVAHIWTAFLVAYQLGQFLASMLGRRESARKMLLIGLGASILVNLVCGVNNSYGTFMLLMFVNGLAQASGWPGCVGGVVHWLRPKERGFIMGIWSTSLIVGNMLVKFCAGWLLHRWGWNQAFFGCALLTLAIWALLFYWQRDRPEDVGLSALTRAGGDPSQAKSAAPHLSFTEYFRLVTHPVILLMGLGYMAVKIVRYSTDSWLTTFLKIRFPGMEKGEGAYYAVIYDVGGLIGMIVAGWALTRVFRGSWALLCLVLGLGMALGYSLTGTLAQTPFQLVLCYGLVGMMVYAADSILKGLASVEVAGERNGMAVSGFVNGIASLGPVIQEQIIGRFLSAQESKGMLDSNNFGLMCSLVLIPTMGLIAWRQRYQKGHLT